MFKITEKLRNWLVDNVKMDKSADEAVVRQSAQDAILDGKLSKELLEELTADENPQRKAFLDEIAKRFESHKEETTTAVGTLLEEKLTPITLTLKEHGESIATLTGNGDGNGKSSSNGDGKSADGDGDGKSGDSKSGSDDDIDARVAAAVAKATEGMGIGAGDGRSVLISEKQAFGMAREKLLSVEDGITPSTPSKEIQVKYLGPEHWYDSTSKEAVYPEKHYLAGRRAYFGEDRALDEPSELQRAVVGAFFKWSAWRNGGQYSSKFPRCLVPNDHDMGLIRYAMHHEKWTGLLHGEDTESPGCISVDNRKLKGGEQKALLDDATGTGSGGLEIAPIVFDNAVILTPILRGQLFPLVNLVNISRGRRIEGATIGNPTFTSGIAEGTPIALFDTTDFIGAFDTNIYNAVGAMEIGMDFESDSPVAIGSIVAERYGMQAMNWLDTQIASGDGSTEPWGIINTTNVTDIDFSTTIDITNMEALLFGVALEYKQESDRGRQVFCSNETNYQSVRGVPVDTADDRRIFGMDHENYMLFGHPYKIVTTAAMANTHIFFAAMDRYRMYRRMGLNVRFEEGGESLALKNTRLIVVRMRYGGQLEDTAAAVLTDNAT